MLRNLFENLLSIVLPKKTEILEIENMTEENIFEKIPRADEIEDVKYRALFQYRDKVVRQAIWQIKYTGNKKITEKFSKLLYEFIIESISDETTFSNLTRPIIAPIPANKSSLKEKGFDQCALIAKEIYKLDNEENFEVCLDALKKTKETEHQSKIKNRAKRLKNLEGSIQAVTEKVVGRNIILIDDVITTGATMKEASKALREAGAKKVIGFAIAH
jgi:competence protein ComFC